MPRLAAIPLLPASTVACADVSGPATVIDGDTLDMTGERIRLDGIDAPTPLLIYRVALIVLKY